MNTALLAIAWYGLLFQIPAGKDFGNLTTATSKNSELPFRVSSGYLIEVEGRIGTQNGLKFLLDTGATISIVDSRIADKIKLERRPAESVSFEGQKADVGDDHSPRGGVRPDQSAESPNVGGALG
jgi:Aspartyl protease